MLDQSGVAALDACRFAPRLLHPIGGSYNDAAHGQPRRAWHGSRGQHSARLKGTGEARNGRPGREVSFLRPTCHVTDVTTSKPCLGKGQSVDACGDQQIWVNQQKVGTAALKNRTAPAGSDGSTVQVTLTLLRLGASFRRTVSPHRFERRPPWPVH
ncbi:hypothetical protein VUR80DRAFT_9021 [Thermomyces stellatus]